ncbi:MAG: hypothetical protein Ct9H300mP1_02610 [Planctomycetaceae bacterium]|nr:MAG: hypothetical protein Ct9H300mP1_02610 [Planctomycetaceae bacterium]
MTRRGRGGDGSDRTAVCQGQPTTLIKVCELTGLPEQTTSKMFSGPVPENLLHRSTDRPTRHSRQAPRPDPRVELLEVAFRLVDSGQPPDGSKLLGRLRQAQRTWWRHVTGRLA